MKKIICRKEYDTDTATEIRKITVGDFGDPRGYEETLCRTPEGAYFLYTNGGVCSLYPAEDIRRMSESKAQSWLAEHE